VTRSSYAVVEYTPQAYLQPDLDLFFSALVPQIANGTGPIIDLIDGADVQTEFQDFGENGESDLDLEYSIALGKSLIHSAQDTPECF
jgi:tripeptidyl-peptidase I